MSPEERQLLAGLFERTKSAASGPRDQEAESFHHRADQAAAGRALSSGADGAGAGSGLAGRQVSVAGARKAGAERTAVEARSPAAFSAGCSAAASVRRLPRRVPRPRRAMAAPAAGRPLGRAQRGTSRRGPAMLLRAGGPQQAAPTGGGFLKGALGTAAGVAGGVLLADCIRGLFHGGGRRAGGNLGIGSGFDARRRRDDRHQ